ncbi:sialate O-acetylesterase [Spirosoma sp. 209]|uniref:sialate O-acetylesterase n=1 Tax=Spirosoma sp. 209 TaxID=1955701 RepID=UPI00098D681A|nr:sialate O-acetylesterase [Spirosoma sp. 209]
MKRLYCTLLLILYYFSVSGQVNYTELPRNLQLYPRDAQNQAKIVVSGTVTWSDFKRIGVKVLREGVVTDILSQALVGESDRPFSFSTTIKAERAEYGIEVYLYTDTDTVLSVTRSRLVCGDVFIIHGQSNAQARVGIDEGDYGFEPQDRFMRNCSYTGDDVQNINWFQLTQGDNSVGGFGITLQRLILANYNIPTLIINGAEGGKPITELAARDPVNPANPYFYYGKLLRRAQWAGVARQVKGFIWKQGEAEAGTDPAGYDKKFATLYDQIREDYGNARIYISQINILMSAQRSGAAALRDFQRRTKYLFKNVETIATVGTRTYDGTHYGVDGHKQMAFEQFRQIARDFYGSTDTMQINSPDIKQAFYNARKDSITLVFDPGMDMVWKADSITYDFSNGKIIKERYQKDYFYLDEQPGWIVAGNAQQNRVKLALKGPATARFLRYLPSVFSDPPTSDFYDGPTLRNKRGIRAFSFDGFPVADAIPTVSTLAAKPISEKEIQLSWPALPTAQVQIIERADGTPVNFRQIASLTAREASFTDTNLPDPFGIYYYRMRAFSAVSESQYSNVVMGRPLVLGIEPVAPLVQVYPNPLATGQQLHIESDQVQFTRIDLRDLTGRLVKSWTGPARKTVSIALDGLATGLYVADLGTTQGHTVQRKLIVR